MTKGEYYLEAVGLMAALKAGEPYRVSRALAVEAVFRSRSGQESALAGESAALEEVARLRELLKQSWRIARVNAKLVTKARLAVLDTSPLARRIRAALREE